MAKLAEVQTPFSIPWTKRYTLREEHEGRINISSDLYFFVINTCFVEPKMVIPLEDFNYLGYRQNFNIQSIGEYYPGDESS
jgi:hypothetical protein